MDFSQATRPIMWNIHTGTAHFSPADYAMYALAFLGMGVFCYGLYQRIMFWRRGKAEGDRFTDLGKRAVLLIKEFLFQNRVRNSFFPAIFHSLIFYSFAALFVATMAVMWDYDFAPLFRWIGGIHDETTFAIFRGWFYVGITVMAEFAGVLLLIGAAMAAYRRYVVKPETLETNFADTWAILFLFLIALTGFLAEGLRIAVLGDPWAILSPVGLLFSYLFTGVSESTGKGIHVFFWWTHTVLAVSWIALLPYTKFFHIITLSANDFFSKLKPRGELKRVDIEAMMSAEDFDEEKFTVGVNKPSEFTWKQRLDFDACIQCGRCEEVCPPFLAKQDFSPRKLIQSLKKSVLEHDAAFLKAKAQPAKSVGAAAEARMEEEKEIVGNAFDTEYVWLCRTCTACMEVCPGYIEHMDTIVEIRRNEVIMQERIPAEAARSLKTLERMGNPFGPQSTRNDWVKTLDAKIVEEGDEVDVLYWPGCCSTFDPTKQRIASDLIKLLRKCNIDYGILGSEERCCGDPARLIGQEHLFQSIAKETVEKLNARKFKIFLTSCPHCYNVFKNEYPQFGGNYNVVHHSEFIHEMIWSGDLKPVIGERSNVTYHDPCYLGRYQKIFDSTREAIKAIPGSKLVEMANNKEKSLCCGGGGGHFWMDIKKGERINNLRVQQAKDVGADTIVTSCAYCMQMLDDSVKIMNMDNELRVIDIATLALRSLGEN